MDEFACQKYRQRSCPLRTYQSMFSLAAEGRLHKVVRIGARRRVGICQSKGDSWSVITLVQVKELGIVHRKESGQKKVFEPCAIASLANQIRDIPDGMARCVVVSSFQYRGRNGKRAFII